MRTMILAALALVIFAMPARADVSVEWFGFAQLTSQQLAERDVSEQDGVTFDADRVRVGMRVKDDKAFGRIHLDLVKVDSAAKEGTLPQAIKDAEVGYAFSNAFKVRVGQQKTPLGLDFAMYGAGLDITKRAMEKQLVLERTIGALFYGRKIGPAKLGYDLFVGNPAGRSGAFAGGMTGHDNSYAARIHFDGVKDLHFEAAFAVDENDAAENYQVFDFGASYVLPAWTFKAEYVQGANVRGVDGDDQTVWYLHAGYLVQSDVEILVRHYQGNRDDGTVSTDLGNTWVGFNYFLGSNKLNSRVQVNYVFVSGDKEDATVLGAGGGSGVYVDNSVLAMFQMHF